MQVVLDAAETIHELGKVNMRHQDVSPGNLVKYRLDGKYRGMLIDYQASLCRAANM